MTTDSSNYVSLAPKEFPSVKTIVPSEEGTPQKMLLEDGTLMINAVSSICSVCKMILSNAQAVLYYHAAPPHKCHAACKPSPRDKSDENQICGIGDPPCEVRHESWKTYEHKNSQPNSDSSYQSPSSPSTGSLSQMDIEDDSSSSRLRCKSLNKCCSSLSRRAIALSTFVVTYIVILGGGIGLNESGLINLRELI